MNTLKNNNFKSPWITYSVGLNLFQNDGLVALGSFNEGPNNEVFILSVENLTMKF